MFSNSKIKYKISNNTIQNSKITLLKSKSTSSIYRSKYGCSIKKPRISARLLLGMKDFCYLVLTIVFVPIVLSFIIIV